MKSTTWRKLSQGICWASALPIPLCPTVGWAQDRDIVVTAQKRQESASTVPIALSAFDRQALDDLAIRSFTDVARFTPGLVVSERSPNFPSFVIRGVSSNTTDSFDESRVGIYQDGVSISKAQGASIDLFDLERVEVAKGPQSTLFGRGAMIGGINLIQHKAVSGSVEGYGSFEVGDFGYRMGEAAINLPYGDAFAVRASGRLTKRDGYVDNALGGPALGSVDTKSGRLALHYGNDNHFSADLIANVQRDESSGAAFKSRNYSPTNPVTGQVLASRDPWTAAAVVAPTGFDGDHQLGVKRTIWGVTGLLRFKLNDAFELHSITAYRRFASLEVNDADGMSLPVLTGSNDAYGKQFSQELRLQFDSGSRLKGFVGAGIFHEDGQQRLRFSFDEASLLANVTGQINAGAAGTGLPATTPAPIGLLRDPAFAGALTQALVGAISGGTVSISDAQAQAIARNYVVHSEEGTNTNRLRSFDLFADGSYDVSDRLELTAGIRYTRDRKTTGFGSSLVNGRSVLAGVLGAAGQGAGGDVAGAQALLAALALPNAGGLVNTSLPGFGVTYPPTPNNGDISEQTQTSGGFTWRLAARYELNTAVNMYATYSRGRRPPVLVVSGPTVPNGQPRFMPISAETVDSYEVGAKGRWLGGRLTTEVSAYVYNYRNFQTVEQRGALFFATNAGKARAYGVEAQAHWQFSEHVGVFGAYAFNHARFQAGAYMGNQFRLSPDHSASIGADLRQTALHGIFSLRPSYSWRSREFFDDNNDRTDLQQPPATILPDLIQDEVQKSYGTANIRLSWEAADLPLTLFAFVTNIANTRYIIQAGGPSDGLGLPAFVAGPPRFFGGGASYRF
jgi:iron complex outermembrane recepter protein